MSRPSLRLIEEQIDVTFPSESVRILCAQPFISFKEPIQEPFPISDECETRLLKGGDCVFDAASLYHPQFIVFPEFSVPGLAGIKKARDAMLSQHIPRSTVLIGGVTGLSQQEYLSLVGDEELDVSVALDNQPDQVPADSWVNTSVTIAKTHDDSVSIWLQPKISPSWPESNDTHQRMFKGRALHLFRAALDDGLPCHFFSAICYDWIGQENGTTAPVMFLQQFNEACRRRGGQQILNWVFVLQHNRRPNDDTFLSATREFLIAPDYSFVNRDDAAILMACTASSRLPSRSGDYGCSSVIHGPRAPFDMRACPSTFSTYGARLRCSDALRICKDSVFRENGECFHEFELRNPRRVRPDATDRSLPLNDARVFSLDGGMNDPRLPGAIVPAIVKWLNDELDAVPNLSADCLAGCQLEPAVSASQASVVATHRSLSSQTAAERIQFAKASNADARPDLDPASEVDDWGQEEREGLEHIVYSLAVIGSVEALDITSATLHARHTSSGVEIVAVRGRTHSDCFEAFEYLAAKTHSPMLLVCRDHHNTTPLPRELQRFADPNHTSGSKVLDAQAMLNKARKSICPELQSFASELFDVSDRRII